MFHHSSLPSLCSQFHAMDTLQKNNYDLAKAMSTLVPQGGPVLCRDEMEEWSASEAMLFEEALEKYGKDFNDIRQDFVSSSFLSSFTATVDTQLVGILNSIYKTVLYIPFMWSSGSIDVFLSFSCPGSL